MPDVGQVNADLVRAPGLQVGLQQRKSTEAVAQAEDRMRSGAFRIDGNAALAAAPQASLVPYTVVEAARRRGEVAIGYRISALEAERDSYLQVLKSYKIVN